MDLLYDFAEAFFAFEIAKSLRLLLFCLLWKDEMLCDELSILVGGQLNILICLHFYLSLESNKIFLSKKIFEVRMHHGLFGRNPLAGTELEQFIDQINA